MKEMIIRRRNSQNIFVAIITSLGLLFVMLIVACGPSVDDLVGAIKTDDLSTISSILDSGIDLKNISEDENPLKYTIYNQKREITKKLIEHGANVNIKINDEHAVFFFINDPEILRMFVDNGCNLKVRDASGYTVLHWAVKNGYFTIIDAMIKHGADIEDNFNERRGFTPLMLAVEAGNFAIVKLLVEAGAKINAVDKEGDVPLLILVPWSRENNQKELVEYLIKMGLDVNVRYKNGMTPLHYAVLTGSYDYIKYLIQHGADVNAKNKLGELPLDLTNRLAKTFSEEDKLPDVNYRIRQEIEALLREYMRN